MREDLETALSCFRENRDRHGGPSGPGAKKTPEQERIYNLNQGLANVVKAIDRIETRLNQILGPDRG